MQACRWCHPNVVVATGSQIHLPPTASTYTVGQRRQNHPLTNNGLSFEARKDLVQAVRATVTGNNLAKSCQISAAGDSESDYWHARLAKAIASHHPRSGSDYG